MKRYSQDGIADEVLGGGSLLKRPREDLGESSNTVAAVSGISIEVLGRSLLKRTRNDLGESSKTVFTASDEVLGGSVLTRHCKDLGESNETVVAESASATPTTNTGGSASGDN